MEKSSGSEGRGFRFGLFQIVRAVCECAVGLEDKPGPRPRKPRALPHLSLLQLGL